VPDLPARRPGAGNVINAGDQVVATTAATSGAPDAGSISVGLTVGATGKQQRLARAGHVGGHHGQHQHRHPRDDRVALVMIDSDMEPDLYADQGGDRFFDVAWKFMMERRTQEEAYRETEGDSLRAKYENWEELLDESLFSVFPPATIAAPYCGPPPSELCYVFQWANKAEEMPPFKLSMIPRDSAAVRAGIQEVAALPTGLILYDARTFRKLPLPWYDYEWVDDEQTLKDTTEDVFQTRNASVLGMPQFCAWDCWAGHNKLKTVGKPVLLPPEIVSGKLAEAMKNLPAGAKVQFMREKIMAPLPAGVEDTPEVRRRLEEVTRATTGGTMS
jgi:hypothetical protein